MHAPEANPHWAPGKKAVQWAAVILLGLSAVLAVLGFGEGVDAHAPHACHYADQAWKLTDPFYRFLLLFDVGEGGVMMGECYPSPLLAAARFLAPLGLAGAILQLGWRFVAIRLDRQRLKTLKGHRVIVGLGARGRAFLEDPDAKTPVVVVELSPDDEAHAFAERRRALMVVGDGREQAVLTRARAADAVSLLAATGDDEDNLRVAHAAMRIAEAAKSAPDIRVMIGDPVVRRSLAAGGPAKRLDVLSVEELAARALCERVRFFELAEIAGARRLHLVLAGRGRLQAALMAQILRTSAFPGHERPRLSLLAADPEAARAEMERAYPGLSEIAEVGAHAFDPDRLAFDAALAEALGAEDPVIAAVVSGDEGRGAYRTALALRDGLRRHDCWGAPIFFATPSPESLRAFVAPLGETPDLAEVLDPFDCSARLCRWKTIEALDEAAIAFHNRYLEVHEELSKTGEPASEADDSLVPWPVLPATYKRANRRVADHSLAKLAALGLHLPEGPPRLASDLNLLASKAELEFLAELEHRSWEIDRRLDGWRPGSIRRNEALIHDCLIPYAELRDKTKEFDRENVRLMAGGGIAREQTAADSILPHLVRHDLWVGLAGPRDLNEAEARDWRRQVVEWMDEVLLPASRGRFVTLVAALAPGADLIGIAAAVERLAAAGRPWRLIAPRAAPFAETLAAFEAPWRAGAVGWLDPIGGDWEDVAKGLTARAGELARRARANRIVPLPRIAAETRAQSLQRQGAYLARRCDQMLVLLKAGADEAASLAEILAWREDPEAIPVALSVAPRPRHDTPADLLATTVLRADGGS